MSQTSLEHHEALSPETPTPETAESAPFPPRDVVSTIFLGCSLSVFFVAGAVMGTLEFIERRVRNPRSHRRQTLHYPKGKDGGARLYTSEELEEDTR